MCLKFICQYHFLPRDLCVLGSPRGAPFGLAPGARPVPSRPAPLHPAPTGPAHFCYAPLPRAILGWGGCNTDYKGRVPCCPWNCNARPAPIITLFYVGWCTIARFKRRLKEDEATNLFRQQCLPSSKPC